MKEIVLQLNWLDIIFLLLALISFILNLYQFFQLKKEEARIYEPTKNGLIGLFNSIKAHDYAIFSMLTSLKTQQVNDQNYEVWVEQSLNSLTQMNSSTKESIVALLVTINPKDKIGDDAFKASEYGLTKEEREKRSQFLSSLQIKK